MIDTDMIYNALSLSLSIITFFGTISLGIFLIVSAFSIGGLLIKILEKKYD